jgi:hypothetical protein
VFGSSFAEADFVVFSVVSPGTMTDVAVLDLETGTISVAAPVGGTDPNSCDAFVRL